jgi:hypothetical protein
MSVSSSYGSHRRAEDIGGDSLSSYGVAVRFAGSARYLPSTGALALFSL